MLEGAIQPFETENRTESHSKYVSLNTLNSNAIVSPSDPGATSEIDETDKEVAYTTRRRRKRKGNGWSKPKGSAKSRSRSRSVYSDSSKSGYSERSRSRSRTSRYSASSRTTFFTDTSGAASDYYISECDSEGLLMENGVRESPPEGRRKRKRRRRGHGWSRQKGSYRSRSRSYINGSTHYHKQKRTNTDGTSRSAARDQKLNEAAYVKLMDCFSDFLDGDTLLNQFTHAYLIQEMNCPLLCQREDELPNSNKSKQPYIKTRFVSKIRGEILEAYKYNVLVCPECNMCEVNPDAMAEHMNKVHSILPLYRCEECAYVFGSMEHYKLHEELHDRSFIGNCLFCSEEFTHRKLYTAHMSLYLSNSYKCLYCGDVYLNRYSYRSHLRKRHNKYLYNSQPGSCIICRMDYKPHTGNPNATQFVIKILIQESIEGNSPVGDGEHEIDI